MCMKSAPSLPSGQPHAQSTPPRPLSSQLQFDGLGFVLGSHVGEGNGLGEVVGEGLGLGEGEGDGVGVGTVPGHSVDS